MIYPANFESRVGFDRIREQIVAACSMNSSRQRITQESFCRSRREVEERLELADQMRQVIMMESGGNISEQEDIAEIIDKVAVEGSYLTGEVCATLWRSLRAASSIISFILSRRAESYPALRRITERVEALPHLQSAIERVVDEKGEVRSSASPELADIRRQIRDHE